MTKKPTLSRAGLPLTRMLPVPSHSASGSTTITGKQLPPCKTRQKGMRECSSSNITHTGNAERATRPTGSGHTEIKRTRSKKKKKIKKLHYINLKGTEFRERPKEYFVQGINPCRDLVPRCFLPVPARVSRSVPAPLGMKLTAGNAPPVPGQETGRARLPPAASPTQFRVGFINF